MEEQLNVRQRNLTRERTLHWTAKNILESGSKTEWMDLGSKFDLMVEYIKANFLMITRMDMA